MSQLPDGFKPFWLTDGHCSCNLFSIDFDPEEEIEKIYRKYSKPKYRKQGWTARRIQDKIDALKKKKKTKQGLNNDIYNGLIKYVKQYGDCYFLVSCYSDEIDSEEISIIDNCDFDSTILTSTDFEENILYKIK